VSPTTTGARSPGLSEATLTVPVEVTEEAGSAILVLMKIWPSSES